MRQFLCKLLLLALPLLQSGCASIVSYSLFSDGCTDFKYGCGPEDEDKKVRYYLGTYMSAQNISAGLPKSASVSEIAGKTALVVDFPFTVVVDTVLAPFVALKQLLSSDENFPTEVGYLEIGTPIRSRDVPSEKRSFQMKTSSNQIRPFIVVRVNGVIYRVAYDQETQKIKQTYTRDKAFSAGGLQVGSLLQVERRDLVSHRHWYVTGPPKNEGWVPIFGSDGGADMVRVTDDGKKKGMGLNRGPNWDDGADPVTLVIKGFYRGED